MVHSYSRKDLHYKSGSWRLQLYLKNILEAGAVRQTWACDSRSRVEDGPWRAKVGRGVNSRAMGHAL